MPDTCDHGAPQPGVYHFTDDEKRSSWPDPSSPHSIACMPAGLEVVYTGSSDADKQVSPVETAHLDAKQPVQAEKEPVQAEKEALQAEKETLAPSLLSASQIEKEVGSPPAAPDGWHAPWAGRLKPRGYCGLSPRVFWTMSVALFIVFGLGIGLGMGLSNLGDDDDGSSESSSTAANPVATSISTITTTARSVLASATAG